MNQSEAIHPEIRTPARQVPPLVKQVLWGTLAAGVAAFVLGLFLQNERTWLSYLVNFLFWSGIAQGGVVMSAVYRMTNARWGEPFRRIGEGMVSFLPVSFVLFIILIIGGHNLFPWYRETIPGKELWLSGTFLFGRDAIAFLILFWVSYRFVAASVRLDLGLISERTESTSWFVTRITSGWAGYDVEKERSSRVLSRLTPVLLILFVTLYSLIGFDLVMALDPYWYSTIFGWMYCLHAFYAALATITILAVISSRWFGSADMLKPRQWHDMGRFIFGFALLSGGFFWSQFLVIWYGNLPEETSYLIKRFYQQPWEPLMWVYIVLAYLFPLVVFLSARIKQIPGALMAISSVILGALFIERLVAVVPFLWTAPTIPFGIVELLMTAGFGAGFLLCWLEFAEFVPLVPSPVEIDAEAE